jgi:hypothetical protein
MNARKPVGWAKSSLARSGSASKGGKTGENGGCEVAGSVAPFFASSGGNSPRRNCGRSRSERHGCPHSRLIYAAQIDDFFSLLQGLVCDKIKRRQSERIAGAGSLSFFML